jgi:endonuclease-3
MVPLEKIGGKTIVYVPQKKTAGSVKKQIDYIKDASAEKIEVFLMKLLPKSAWLSLTYRLIDHGRALCKAQNPKCLSCPLASCCPVRR